jgi:hypothetical protein
MDSPEVRELLIDSDSSYRITSFLGNDSGEARRVISEERRRRNSHKKKIMMSMIL